MKLRVAILVVSVLVLLGPLSATAQEHTPSQPEAPAAGQASSADAHAQPETAGAGPAHAGGEAGEADPHAEFKYSPSVQWLARNAGIEVATAYWVSAIFNFAVVAWLLYFLGKSFLPGYFRDRTASIRQSIEEARRASEDAQKRLADIESRLTRIDAEIAGLRDSAEAEARAEDARVRASADEEKARIIRAAEQEIAAASRMALRNLKAYAAELAISMAESRIQVSPDADRELVRDFSSQLSRDGK